MLTYRKISDAAEEAYRKGELFEFLTGRSGYHYPCPDAQVDVPTDWTRVIPGGIYNLYNRWNDPQIIKEYQNAIGKAIGQSPKDLWCAVNILFFQLRKEKQGKAPFAIDPELCGKAAKKIEAVRPELEKEYPYGRKGLNMFEDIRRLDKNFAGEWGAGFLPSGGQYGDI